MIIALLGFTRVFHALTVTLSVTAIMCLLRCFSLVNLTIDASTPFTLPPFIEPVMALRTTHLVV